MGSQVSSNEHLELVESSVLRQDSEYGIQVHFLHLGTIKCFFFPLNRTASPLPASIRQIVDNSSTQVKYGFGGADYENNNVHAI